MKKTTVTLYVATQNVWGAPCPAYYYFETIKERNAFVRNNDYTDKAGTVKLTESQYEDFKQSGTWEDQTYYDVAEWERKIFDEKLGEKEIDGLLYTIYKDRKSGEEYTVRETRTVCMGFDSTEAGKIEEFVSIVEREGACQAIWETMAADKWEKLARQLADELPQYDWEIWSHWLCKATKK